MQQGEVDDERKYRRRHALIPYSSGFHQVLRGTNIILYRNAQYNTRGTNLDSKSMKILSVSLVDRKPHLIGKIIILVNFLLGSRAI